MRSERFRKAFEKLAEAEDRFLQSEFLAPAMRGGSVRVRVAGIVCTLKVEPTDFEGWGVFRPTSPRAAELARRADLSERRRYLELFPLVRLILTRFEAGRWLAVPAQRGDRRFVIEGLAPVHMVEEAQQFEIARTRFDGSAFWFEDVDPTRDPATAAYLRESLRGAVEPSLLARPGLTPEERAAYTVNYWLAEEVRKKLETERTERRLRDALGHAGAELADYLERNDSFRVTYQIGGRRHVSAVAKGDLTVQSAGICLSGQDARFDLASLVGVIREGERIGELYD